MKKFICLGLIVIVALLLNTKEGYVNSMNLMDAKVSPYCENVTYTSDSGFICLTNQQKNQLYIRGGSHSILDADIFNLQG
jgi:hypothetical protein